MDMNEYPVLHEQVAARVVDGAAVVVLADVGEVNILNSVGTRVWELCDGSRSVNDIVRVIVDEFEVSQEEASRDVQEFLASLVQAKALVMERRPKGMD